MIISVNGKLVKLVARNDFEEFLVTVAGEMLTNPEEAKMNHIRPSSEKHVDAGKCNCTVCQQYSEYKNANTITIERAEYDSLINEVNKLTSEKAELNNKLNRAYNDLVNLKRTMGQQQENKQKILLEQANALIKRHEETKPDLENAIINIGNKSSVLTIYTKLLGDLHKIVTENNLGAKSEIIRSNDIAMAIIPADIATEKLTKDEPDIIFSKDYYGYLVQYNESINCFLTHSVTRIDNEDIIKVIPLPQFIFK